MSVTLLFSNHILLLFKWPAYLGSMFFIVSILLHVWCCELRRKWPELKGHQFFLTTFVTSQVGLTLCQVTEVLAICFVVSAEPFFDSKTETLSRLESDFYGLGYFFFLAVSTEELVNQLKEDVESNKVSALVLQRVGTKHALWHGKQMKMVKLTFLPSLN